MSGGITIGLVDLAALSFEFDRVRCVSVSSLRNWCGHRLSKLKESDICRDRRLTALPRYADGRERRGNEIGPQGKIALSLKAADPDWPRPGQSAVDRILAT